MKLRETGGEVEDGSQVSTDVATHLHRVGLVVTLKHTRHETQTVITTIQQYNNTDLRYQSYPFGPTCVSKEALSSVISLGRTRKKRLADPHHKRHAHLR